jgi:hypothetical protein
MLLENQQEVQSSTGACLPVRVTNRSTSLVGWIMAVAAGCDGLSWCGVTGEAQPERPKRDPQKQTRLRKSSWTSRDAT